MPFPLILLPAYGRKYKTQAAAIADWNGGADFKIEDGPYCSIRDYDEMVKQFKTISIRYARGLYAPVGALK